MSWSRPRATLRTSAPVETRTTTQAGPRPESCCVDGARDKQKEQSELEQVQLALPTPSCANLDGDTSQVRDG